MKRSKSKPDRTVVLPGQMDLFAETSFGSRLPKAAIEIQTRPPAPVTAVMTVQSARAELEAAPLEPVLERPRATQRRPRKEPGRLLDVSAAAEYVGLSASTLNKMRCLGEGPKYLKLTRSAVRYDPADLDAWLSVRKRASTSEV